MISVLFYGNCQPSAVMETLNLDKNIYSVTYIPCYSNDFDEATFLNFILKSDIIITQHIKDNYRDKNYLSTSYIVNNVKKTTKIILFDSCWFDFYYVGLFGLIDNQIPYHLDSLIDCYKKNIQLTNI
jgi:hypothetical protein